MPVDISLLYYNGRAVTVVVAVYTPASTPASEPIPTLKLIVVVMLKLVFIVMVQVAYTSVIGGKRVNIL